MYLTWSNVKNLTCTLFNTHAFHLFVVHFWGMIGIFSRAGFYVNPLSYMTEIEPHIDRPCEPTLAMTYCMSKKSKLTEIWFKASLTGSMIWYKNIGCFRPLFCIASNNSLFVGLWIVLALPNTAYPTWYIDDGKCTCSLWNSFSFVQSMP